MSDDINSPNHYTANGVECIDMIHELVKSYASPEEGYQVGSVWKYLYRAPHKGTKLKDLRKARWFLDKLIQMEEAKPGKSERMLEKFYSAPTMVADPDEFKEAS